MVIACINRVIGREAGFTLVELMVVVTIAGMLIVAFGAGFAGWREKYFVESDIKAIHTLLMEAKLIAVKEKRYVFVNVPSGDDYTIRTYKDTFPPPAAGYPFGNGELDTGSNEDEELTSLTMRNKLELNHNYRHFWFNAQGMLKHKNDTDNVYRDFQIRLMKLDENVSADADYNCLLMEPPLFFATGVWNATAEQEEDNLSYREMIVSINRDADGIKSPLCKVK